ncbi:uncharacterized protein BT62DRAFT_924560 [Guyanagaster necrorhizus]|uniref:Uncharacterized protein n=1 Tax=Guyanagaster necrorhizus TaxID=856835 RepID=A0A9P7VGE9_9AGAR|nr:uncharacterized protein BT62DRAFT_924560 [Guyanagaster necrorhizus MCA 3950]KAG7439661.1 hypothetical protein BT62DRAFT_924560 [Guyanagaster necrorhizus MCA 3950]
MQLGPMMGMVGKAQEKMVDMDITCICIPSKAEGMSGLVLLSSNPMGQPIKNQDSNTSTCLYEAFMIISLKATLVSRSSPVSETWLFRSSGCQTNVWVLDLDITLKWSSFFKSNLRAQEYSGARSRYAIDDAALKIVTSGAKQAYH